MRKINLQIILLNIAISIVLSVFGVYTVIQLDLSNTHPFQMSENMIEAYVSNRGYIKASETKNTLMNIAKYVKNIPCTIIVDNIDLMGLAIYDSSGKYKDRPLVSGNYFNLNDYNSNQISILTLKNSFIDNYSKKHNNIYDLNGQPFTVKGLYDSKYDLYSSDHEFIQSLFTISDLRGHYYFDSMDYDNVVEFLEILKNNGFTYKIANNSFKASPTRTLKNLASNSTYFTTFIGVLFIYINCFLFYKIYLKRLQKIFKIHIMFGATKLSFLYSTSKFIILDILIGSTLGILIYIIMFRLSALKMTLYLIPIIILVNILFNYFVYLFSFYSEKASRFY